jgi:hypothetical protein
MATKLEFEEVMMVINQNVKDPETKKSLLADLRQLEADKQAEKEEAKEDGPKAKNKHVFFVRKASDGTYADAGFLIKTPQESDTSTLLQRIQQSAAQQNNKPKSGRGRKSKGGKIEKYYDYFHGIKREYSKAVSISPMKELVQVVVLESDEIDFSK